MSHRLRTLRAATVVVALALLLSGCAVDRENYPHAGESGGWTQGSVVRTVLLYLGVPVAVAVVLSVLSLLPSARRRHRYRPQEGWSAEPVWFAGPPDPARAVEQAHAGDVTRGGAGGSW